MFSIEPKEIHSMTSSCMKHPVIANILALCCSLGASDWYKYLYSTDAVTMDIFDTTYYGLDEEGAKDWGHILPPGDNAHIVQLNSDDEEGTPANYTVALFHQLKCLEIYYREYSLESTHKLSPIIHHCLNYLRQQILCQLDTKLESVRTEKAQSARFYATVCRDWTRVYEAASLVSYSR